MADAKDLQVDVQNNNNGAGVSTATTSKQKKKPQTHQHTVDEKHQQPTFCGKLIVKCPCLLCCVILLFLCIVIAIDAQVFELSANDNRTFLIDSNTYVEQFDAYALAAQAIGDSGELDDAEVLPQTEMEDWWTYSHLFTLKDYNNDFDVNNAEKTDYWILTRENVETIIKYENRIYEDPVWRNQFCWAGPYPLLTNYTCDFALHSAAREVYNHSDFDTMTTQDIQSYIMSLIELNGDWARHFNPGVAETGQAYIYRSFFLAGVPIATDWWTENGTTVHDTSFRNSRDNIEEQELEYIEWGTEVFRELTVDHNGGLVDGDLEVLSVSFAVYNSYFMVLVGESTTWITFSVIAVLVYMSVHLSSIFLSAMALIQILMSFPLAYFVYRIVFQIPHYDTLSTLIIFVLLGVGADDVFVFTDAWLQSLYFVKDTDDASEEDGCWENDGKSCVCRPAKETRYLMARMSFAYRRSAKAMLVTQITTFCAFLATATSQIMPIAAFGIWAALVVAMNYVLVITIYPTIVIIHEVFIKKYESMLLCFCCRACKKLSSGTSSNNDTVEPVEPDNATTQTKPRTEGDGDDDADGDMAPELQRQLSEEEERATEYRCFEQFLYRQWSAFIVRFKYAILFVFLVIFVLAAYFGGQMEAQSEDEAWFAADHFMQRSIDKSGEFSASETDNLVAVTVTFGIDGVDRSGTSRWNPKEYGSVIWQDDFDISSPEAQSFLLALCDDLKNSDLVYAGNLVECPMQQFADYVEFIGETFPYQSGGGANETFGATYNDFISSAYSTYTSLSLVEYDADAEDYVIRFYAMHAPTKVVWDADAPEQVAARDAWGSYIAEFSAMCPGTVCRAMGNVTLRWCWLVTQEAFVRSALQGILIAMPLAFIILLLSTGNWVISVFAVIDIIGIMLCELSVMYLQGWKFGVSECIAIVIIIGFSVDYVVHLANSYLESTATDRVHRLSFALLTMGISVVSGAVTTFAAGFFLIFPPIVFFYKMGVLMISTVTVSIVWAMCFFTSIVALWGPEHDVGNLKNCLSCCCGGGGGGDKKSNDGTAVRSLSSINRNTYRNYDGHEEHIKGYALEVEH